MRFRITKNNDGSVYVIVVSGEVDDEAGWDILQIGQTMLSMPHCTELVIDLRSALIDEEFSVFTTDTLLAVFEGGLMQKDRTLVIQCSDDQEIRLCSDQQLLSPAVATVSPGGTEARFYSRVMKWLERESRFMIN